MSEKKYTDLVAAALAYVKPADEEEAFQLDRTKKLQEAAALARKGDQQGARQITSRLQITATRVFSFEHVLRDLRKAVKPFKATTPSPER